MALNQNIGISFSGGRVGANGIGVTTQQHQKNVADPNDKYLSLRPLWDRAKAMIGGQRQAKVYDATIDTYGYENLLLPFNPTMDQRQYNFYRAEAELPGIVSQYARVLVGGLLRKPPSMKLPEDVPEGAENWLLNEFSADGSPMITFLDKMLWEELQTSRAWVYVDYPEVGDVELTPQEQREIKPYPVMLNAESVVNWRTGPHPITGKTCLLMWITRSYREVYDENEFHPKLVDTAWVHEITPEGYFRIRIFEQEEERQSVPYSDGEALQRYEIGRSGGGSGYGASPDGTFRFVREVYPMMNGEQMMYIPAFPVNGNVEPTEPILQPLIDREVALYNKMSRRNHLLYGAATYTPVIMSDMTDDEFDDVVRSGLGSWIRLRQEDDIKALETPTAALADMETSIQNGIEELAKLGIRMLAKDNVQSGVALELRNASQTAQLGTLNAKISAEFRHIIAIMLNWRYGTDYSAKDIEFTLTADLTPAPYGADHLRLVTEWYENGIIPRSVFINIAKQNDIIPSEYNDDEGVTEIEEDELIATPKEQFDMEMMVAEASAVGKASVIQNNPARGQDQGNNKPGVDPANN